LRSSWHEPTKIIGYATPVHVYEACCLPLHFCSLSSRKAKYMEILIRLTGRECFVSNDFISRGLISKKKTLVDCWAYRLWHLNWFFSARWLFDNVQNVGVLGACSGLCWLGSRKLWQCRDVKRARPADSVQPVQLVKRRPQLFFFGWSGRGTKTQSGAKWFSLCWSKLQTSASK
jgi:hypothetical protein